MKAATRGEDVCFMCGAPATTDDHIPPRCMFPKPRPRDLIKVRACYHCNDKTKLDDEYFRLIVAAGSSDSPRSIGILQQRIIPRLRRAPALVVNFMKSVQKVHVYSRSGIYLGGAAAFSFDHNRIQTVIDKIAKGLFFTHTGRRLPADCVVEEFLYNPPIEGAFREAVERLPLVTIGDGSVFSYRYWLPDPLGSESYWFLMFYDDTSLFVTQTTAAPNNVGAVQGGTPLQSASEGDQPAATGAQQ